MVAQVLQFPQVVGTDEGGHAPSGYLIGNELPGWPDGSPGPDRQRPHPAAGNPVPGRVPGSGLPAAACPWKIPRASYPAAAERQSADGGIFPHSNRGNRPGKGCHLRKGGSRKEPQVIGDQYDPGFGRNMVENGMVVQQGFCLNWDGKPWQESAAAWICLHRWFPPVHRYSRAGSPAKDCLPLHSGQRVWSDSV